MMAAMCCESLCFSLFLRGSEGKPVQNGAMPVGVFPTLASSAAWSVSFFGLFLRASTDKEGAMGAFER